MCAHRPLCHPLTVSLIVKYSLFLRLPLCFGDIKISEWNLFFLHFLHFTECIAAPAVALSVFLLFFSTAAQQMVTAKPQFYLFPFLFKFDSLLKNHIGTAGFFFAALCKVLHRGWLQTIQKSPKCPQKFLPRLEAQKESPKKIVTVSFRMMIFCMWENLQNQQVCTYMYLVVSVWNLWQGLDDIWQQLSNIFWQYRNLSELSVG